MKLLKPVFLTLFLTAASASHLNPSTRGIQVPTDLHLMIHDANSVRVGISNTGQMGNDLIHGNGLGFWPGNTPNNYIFGMGLWIGGLADLDGDGTKDTVVVTGYDPRTGASEFREGRVSQDPTDPLARVFSSTILEDLGDWPEEFCDSTGAPIVYSPQDFVTTYNDIGGEPQYEAGRFGLEVRQRSMAFVGGLNHNAIIVFFEIVNRSDSLPDGPYTFEEAYVGFTSDVDIGVVFADDMFSILDSVEVYGREKVVLNTAIAWDTTFSETNFIGDPGFVGMFFLQPPGNSWDGIDNDGDGMVDESPFDGVDDDGDGVPDDIPDEVDAVDDFHFTVMENPFSGQPPYDPTSDSEAYRMMRCLTEEACGERDHATDIRFLISIGPFDLPPGESQIAGVAIIFADPVGDPDHLALYGDPPRPDPQDTVLTDFIATILGTRALYDSGFEFEYDVFEILGTFDHSDTNDPAGPYLIYTNVIDSIPLARVTLNYSIDSTFYDEVLMEHQFVNAYGGELPGQPFWSTITYYIQAVDSAFQSIRDPENAPITTYGFSIFDVPDFNPRTCEGCANAHLIAPADFDLDGLPDLFIGSADGLFLYRNLGDFVLEDVTAETGIEAPLAVKGASWGDYDNDGYPDLFIGSLSSDDPHLLYRNLGDGMFEDVTGSAGLSDSIITTSGIWGDVNGDGFLDLLTAQIGRDRLYLNNGDGTFIDRAEEWGIEENENDRAVSFFDFDGDRDIDLLLTGGLENIVYKNTGESSFVDVTTASGIGDERWSSVATGDYDSDGDVDILFSGGILTLYENTGGSGVYSDVTNDLGLSGSPPDASLADLNADGRIDIVTSQLVAFIRKPGEGFVNLTALSGLAQGRIANFVLPLDVNGDGLLDLVAGDIMENAAYGGYWHRHWLEVSLKGTLSNRSAFGTGVRVYSGDYAGAGWVNGGDGISQDSPILYFGLDTLTVIDSLVVDWPSGVTQKLEGVAVDQLLEIEEDSTLGIKEGSDKAQQLPRVFSLMQNYPNPFNPTTTITFDVPGEAGEKKQVRLTIYDIRGRRVKTLIDSELEPGRHRVVWDGRNDRGQRVASGIYLYTLKSGDKTHTRKMVLLQ